MSTPKEFGETRAFKIGPCQHKGKGESFCDGHYNGPRCPMKYAFFGLLVAQGGYLEKRAGPEGGECPEYMEWSFPWKGKTEYVAVIDGKQEPGFKPDVDGPCMSITMKATSDELLNEIARIYEMIPEGARAITRHLIKSFDASDDIRERAFRSCSHRHEIGE